MDTFLSRRDVLKSAGVAAAGIALASAAPALASGLALNRRVTEPGRRRVLRLGHLTDIHVQPELHANEGMVACLRHVLAQKDKPELILTGGDAVMDAFGQAEPRARLLFEMWKKILKDECPLPMEHCIGNHDIWGWDKKHSKLTGDEPNYGKKWAMEVYGVAKPYRSFDRAGWHFVVLDTVYPNGDGYFGRLDDEQFEWLKGDLAAVKAGTPVLVLSHIPIVTAGAFFDTDPKDKGDWTIPRARMLEDAWRLKDLFGAHRNVRLCLSGHIHLQDRVDYNGVTYLCDGAVSGAWWKGKNHECDAGYAMINLFDDGSFEHEYVNYGWVARP
jgi:Icc protein